MAVGLAADRVQVSSYVPKPLKERAERLRRILASVKSLSS